LSAQLSRPQFKELQLRLMAYCIRVFHELGIGGGDAIISGVALSPEDFVGDVLADYAVGKIKHHSSKGSLVTVLCTALRNDVIDALRHKRHQREHAWPFSEEKSDTDGVRPKTVNEIPRDDTPDVLAALDEDAYKGRVRKALAGEPLLLEVVDAVFEFNSLKPEQIGELIGVTAAEVQNRKKRLRRRLVTLGLVHVKGKKVGS
jgi:DNA-directed RNA polymerase specialized sigma24 family protein